MRPHLKHLAIIILIACFQRNVNAQTPVALSPVPAQQFFSQAGAPLAGGCIYTFISQTSTPLATFTDGTGTATNPNPVILDGGGFGNLWLSNSSYRFQIWSYGSGAVGSNCGNGTQQRQIDNISAYTIINQAQAIFLSGVTSDPGGTAGEMIYRSDIPCFRGFTTFWDCFVRLTDTQTLTNKTLTAPTINSPIIATPTINGASTGTGIQGTDTKLLTAGTISATAAIPICTDANGGATTTGCVTAVQVDLTGQTANIASTTIVTPAVNGFYRASCFLVDTQAATTSSTLPSCNISYTQADTGLLAALLPISGTVTTNQVGDQGAPSASFANYFYAKGGSPIKYFTSSYASSGATSLAYAVHIRLEGPF